MKEQKGGCTRECGVSESIGFMLIFTIVVMGIGLVTLYGYPMLLKQQVGADEQIMEKNMIVLQNDAKSLAYKLVPYKETSLKVGSGALALNNPQAVHAVSTISITDCNSVLYIDSFKSGDLRYESPDAGEDISLQNGAVLKRARVGGGSVMLAEPRWFSDSPTNTMVINLVSLNSTDRLARTGIATVRMTLGMTSFQDIPVAVGDNVCVVYTPDTNPNADLRADFSLAWNTYFTTRLPMTRDAGAGSAVTYRIVKPDPDTPFHLVVKQYDIMVNSL